MTTLVVVLTCVVSVAAWRTPRLLERLILYPPAITYQRQWDRLVGYGLVHADVWHLTFNMLTLWSFGVVAQADFEALLPGAGAALFLGVYLSALVISIWPSYLRHRRDARFLSLGASGAVSAVLAYVVMLRPTNLVYVFALPMPGWMYLLLFVAVSAWLAGRPESRVNHQAHLVGTAYGVCLALVGSAIGR